MLRDCRADRSRQANCQHPLRGAEPRPRFPSSPAPYVRGPAAPRALGLRAILATPRGSSVYWHGGKSQIPGHGDSELGKGDACCLGQRPTIGEPANCSRVIRAALRGSPHSLVSEWPGSSQPTLLICGWGLLCPPPTVGGVESFFGEYFVRTCDCAPGSLGPRVSGSTK